MNNNENYNYCNNNNNNNDNINNKNNNNNNDFETGAMRLSTLAGRRPCETFDSTLFSALTAVALREINFNRSEI